MNTEELKQSLAAMADDVRDHGSDERLAGVDHKLALRRRTTMLGAGLAAAVAVTAVVAAPSLLDAGGGDAGITDATPTSPVRTHDAREIPVLPTIEDNGQRFFISPAGNRLLAHQVGDEGVNQVLLRFTPPTTNLLMSRLCTAGDGASLHGNDFPAMHVTVNGHEVSVESCGGDLSGPPGVNLGPYGYTKAENAKFWRGLGVRPGEESVIRLVLRRGVGGPRMTIDQAQLGVAMYAYNAPSVVKHGIEFDKVTEWDGQLYRLTAIRFDRVSGGEALVRADLVDLSHEPLVRRDIRGSVGGSYVGTLNDVTHRERKDRTSLLGTDVIGGFTGDQVTLGIKGAARDGAELYMAVYERTK